VKLQVLETIVQLVPVPVVDNLFGGQQPIKVALNHKPVLPYSTASTRRRVVRRILVGVTVWMNQRCATPTRALLWILPWPSTTARHIWSERVRRKLRI
jgi:hypothetical protein